MRTHVLVLVALSLPALVSAQGVGLPRTGRTGGVSKPTPLPPEIPVVARDMALKRSRWSAEGYTLVSSVHVADPTGAASSYSAFGTGTRADYRVSDHFSGTVDMTATFLGGSSVAETAEIGGRYKPIPHNTELRPYVDLRASYMHVHETFFVPTDPAVPLGGPSLQMTEVGRSGRGVGAVAGVGFEYTLTQTLALSTEATAMRNRMTAYSVTAPASFGSRSPYWMTSFRYTIGLRYNAASVMHLSQNPMK